MNLKRVQVLLKGVKETARDVGVHFPQLLGELDTLVSMDAEKLARFLVLDKEEMDFCRFYYFFLFCFWSFFLLYFKCFFFLLFSLLILSLFLSHNFIE